MGLAIASFYLLQTDLLGGDVILVVIFRARECHKVI